MLRYQFTTPRIRGGYSIIVVLAAILGFPLSIITSGYDGSGGLDYHPVPVEVWRASLTKPSVPRPTWCGLTPHSVHRSEVAIDGPLANFATVRGPFFDRFAEVESNEDARIRILYRRLGEAGIRAEHRGRIATGAPGWECHATILEADPVGAEELLEHFCRRSPFDGVT